MKRAMRPIMIPKRIGIMSPLFDGVLLVVEVNMPLDMSVDTSSVVAFIVVLISLVTAVV